LSLAGLVLRQSLPRKEDQRIAHLGLIAFTRGTRDNDRVPIVPRGLVDQSKIKPGVKKAERILAPDVIRIMYAFADDWQGDSSLFFRIIISDAVSSPNKLRETTQRIIARVRKEIKAEELGVQTYFHFRSQAEQALLREPSWEP
jgi:hypothetical protein